LFVFPLELPVILLGLVALPHGRWARLARGVLVAALAGDRAAEGGGSTRCSRRLGRGFNPVADLALIEAGLRLVTGSIGLALTLGAVLAALASRCRS
jgi:hypothetical protein